MIDVNVTFENAVQIHRFRDMLICNFSCSDDGCSSCKYRHICDILVKFIVDLGAAELKYAGDKK